MLLSFILYRTQPTITLKIIFIVYNYVCFFFNDTATTVIYTYLHTLSLHDALPIFASVVLRAVDAENPPFHLLVGADGFESVQAKMDRLKADMDAWRAVSSDTAYDRTVEPVSG